MFSRGVKVPFCAKNGPNLGRNINFQGRALKFAPEVWFHALRKDMDIDFEKLQSKVPSWAKNVPNWSKLRPN